MEDKMYEILKDLPLIGGSSIKKGTYIYEKNGLYYMDNGMLPKEYQEDFRKLIKTESQTGWKYIVPVKEKEAFKL